MTKLKTPRLLAAALLFSSLTAFSQSFTWKRGSNMADQSGIYGTPGVAAAGNDPGAREGSASWTDASGNLWLFGGIGFDNTTNADALNDLWKYSPATNQWTWMKGSNTAAQSGVYGTLGVSAAANNPGARILPATWTDATGNLWLFGGTGYDLSGTQAELNDLWKYNPATNQWTWVSGSNTTMQLGVYGTMGVAASANKPGARYGASGWADAAGNFWLFGGEGYDGTNTSYPGLLCDVWKYNPATGQWTWVKGSNMIDQPGIYGTQGTAASANSPGGRFVASAWVDAAGNTWLFGGLGFDNTSFGTDYLNDLWKYNPAANQWTWMKGSNTSFQQGTYGTLGVSAAANTPGARLLGANWADASGNLWLFGGSGIDNAGNVDNLNDLWKYNTGTGQWTWVKGSNLINQPGIYGTQGVSSAANIPGARYPAATWFLGATNSLWLFGGFGSDGMGNVGELNDMWLLSSCTAQTLAISTSTTLVCAGQPVTLMASGAASYSWSTGQAGAVITATPGVTTTYTVSSTDAAGCGNQAAITQSVAPSPALSVSSSATITCARQPVIFTASGAATYSWSSGQNTGTITVTPSVTTSYTLTGSSANGCTGSVALTHNVSNCTGIESNAAAPLSISVYPNPSNGEFIISFSHELQSNSLSIVNNLGQTVFEQPLNGGQNTVKTGLSTGIYYYHILQAGKVTGSGKLLIE